MQQNHPLAFNYFQLLAHYLLWVYQLGHGHSADPSPVIVMMKSKERVVTRKRCCYASHSSTQKNASGRERLIQKVHNTKHVKKSAAGKKSRGVVLLVLD